MRYEAGGVTVRQLMFSNETSELNEIQDLVLYNVRPMFSALPAVSATPPCGGNQRSILLSRSRHRMLVSDWSSDVCFFFLSRRRHTRLVSDWSSDVCSR